LVSHWTQRIPETISVGDEMINKDDETEVGNHCDRLRGLGGGFENARLGYWMQPENEPQQNRAVQNRLSALSIQS